MSMALRLKELYPKVNYQYVITPTGDELPPMQQHWRNLEFLLEKKLKKLPSLTLEECIKREKMIPNFRARFCTRIIKIEPFIDFMQNLPRNSKMYVGLRADETGRLGILPPDAHFKIRFPLRYWRWGIDEVLNYLEKQSIKIPKRTDCGACFFQRLPEWKELLDKYPNRYQRYINIEEEMGYTFRSPGRDTWPASLKDLKKEFESGRKVRKTKARDKDPSKCRFCSM